jgi:hypothetical protein
MLITFKSSASADVIMLGESGRHMLALLGKDASEPRGIITAEQLPAAIARLKTAIAEEKAQAAAPAAEETDSEQTGMAAPVRLAQRAWPLLDLCERALANRVPVVWGI